MLDIVKNVRHGLLKGGANILKSKWEFFIRKISPWTNEHSFMLIDREYVYAD